MGRFKSIAAGPRQRKTVTLPFPGARYDPITGKWEGPTDQLDIRALRSDEDTKIVELAIAFAKTRGIEKPVAGDEIYERGRLLYTLAVACLDKDSPVEAPAPYFENVQEIDASDLLLPETLEYLLQHQRSWQEEISPIRMNVSEEEYIAGVMRATRGDIDFFVSMRQGMQWSFFVRMARQLLSLMTPESQPSSPPESQPPTA